MGQSADEAKLKRLMAEVEQGQIQISPQRNDRPSRLSESLAKWRLPLKTRFLVPPAILLIPWSQEIIDQVIFQGGWNLPLHPRSLAGLPGVVFSAFSHSGFEHLISNSIAFAIFSWLILLKSQKDFWYSFTIGWIGGGLLCWLLGPQSVHGLSGVVYTLFGYLLAIGWLERRFMSLAISVFVLINYSSVIWGVLPTQPTVAWWGHLFGFLLGILAAYGVYREPASQLSKR